MKDYARMTKAELISRLKALDSRCDMPGRRQAQLRRELLYETTRNLDQPGSLAEVVPNILKVVCQLTQWEMGELWSLTPKGDALAFAASWRSPDLRKTSAFESKARRLSFASGEGLPGRVWSGGEPIWIEDVSENGNFARAPEAVKAGFHGALAFPIRLGEKVLGVMSFFCRSVRQADPELIRLFAEMGSQIGQFIERKRVEQNQAELAASLAEKNKELETIVYVASHDLRSPLINIQGFSQDLAQTCEQVQTWLAQSPQQPVTSQQLMSLLKEEVPEAIKYIQASVSKIDSLLSGLLRFSRLGRAALRIEPIDMNSMISDIAKTLEFQLQQAGATLQVESLPFCQGDFTQVNQVFTNLLDNALKYLQPDQSGRILVSGVANDSKVIYRVQDNGVGIAPEHIESVFQIFQRLDPTDGRGEGLGLTIAQRIVERLHGRIWVESEPGQGSTFFVELPACEAIVNRPDAPAATDE